MSSFRREAVVGNIWRMRWALGVTRLWTRGASGFRQPHDVLHF